MMSRLNISPRIVIRSTLNPCLRTPIVFLVFLFRGEWRKTDLAILGIPYDLATTGRAGTRHGPQAVRIASANLRWEEKRLAMEF